MSLLLIAAAATQISPIDAERAFAADAHKLGQWTAFRKWAADDAVMFVPQPVNAQQWLKDKKDPPVPVFWWPGRSYVSCDGSYAVNTGPWVREWGKSVGYFTTVWKRQPDDSWKWVYDGGDALETPRAEGGDIKSAIASCEGRPAGMMTSPPIGEEVNGGSSPDRTLVWRWSVSTSGSRDFQTWLWNGRSYDEVVVDQVAVPLQ